MAWDDVWPPHEVQLSRSRLVDLVGVVGAYRDESPGGGVQAALARFLAVRSCGHIEFTFDECTAEFARRASHPKIANHVRGGLFRGRNPRPGVLADRLHAMSPEWAHEFNAYLDGDDKRVRRELGLLVDRRNNISHGQNEGLGVRKALDLSGLALEVGDWLSLRLDPDGAE